MLNCVRARTCTGSTASPYNSVHPLIPRLEWWLRDLIMERAFQIAIQPDDNGPGDSSSPIWTRVIEEAGHRVVEVDVRRADILDQLHGCQGFMWRHTHRPDERFIARRLLPTIEAHLGILMYPNQATCWHYDDKVAQRYLLEALGLPIPQTWIWFDAKQSWSWAKEADYPLVVKLSSGAGASNVALIRSSQEARTLINRSFGSGLYSVNPDSHGWRANRIRLRPALNYFLNGKYPPRPNPFSELHRDYVLFQEFLPNNEFDTRITIIGDRAFGFRRFNRPDDFRASGSGEIDYDPRQIDLDFVRLGFEVASRLRAQSCAIDGLKREGAPVISEVSYTYVSSAVRGCPGHWDRSLEWHSGHMWPEEAQAQGFLGQLKRSRSAATAK
jgi:glutathione synthase/RimK-type ligase-like ATP-grasp enzyme